jgi:hypothetical protein
MVSYELDRFGGWKGKRFQATGYFRVEKDERWWLVTPEGNAFLSFGINHLQPDLWQQSYNSETWKSKLDVEDIRGSELVPALKAWFVETCQQYGINTVGVHSDLSIANYQQSSLPYVQPIEFVDIPHYRNDVVDEDFVDVFSDDFQTHCDQMARDIAAPLRDDPFLLAYAMTDCPLLTYEDCRERTDTIGGAPRESRIGWPRRLRNLPRTAPGKQAYTETIRVIYKSRITDFNATYGTSFESFDDLLDAVDWRPEINLSNGNEIRDNVEFLKQVVDKYYQTARESILRHDPNHLFIGDKLNANTDSLETLIPITSKYTDVIFIQMYGRYDVQGRGLDRWTKVTDKPFINGDTSYTMITENMPRPYGPVADNLAQRAEWTDELFINAFARPEFVGWHYCGLIDTPNLIPSKRLRQHSGFLDGHGTPYPDLEAVLNRRIKEMYKIATDGTKRR